MERKNSVFDCLGSMKRGRQDYYVCAPNAKRHQPGDGTLAEDALAYFRLVKEVYKDNKEVSDNFTKLMQDYKTHSIKVPELYAKVKVLFKDHHYLILGFRAFIPHTDYEIEVEDLPKRPVDLREALNYVRKVKVRFLPDVHSYHEFLKSLFAYRKGNKTSHGVHQEVAFHLRNYPDLLEEFKRFLPENNVTQSICQVQALASTQPVARAYKREMEEDFDDDESSSEEDDDRKYHPCITAKGNAKDRHSSKEKQLDEKPDGVEHTLPLKKAVNFRVHSGEGSRFVAQSTYPRPLTEGGTISFFQKEVDFLTLIKGDLPKKDSFQKLLKYIHMHSDDLITREELDVLVSNGVFQDCPELISRFNNFMSECETTERKFLSSRQQGSLREQRKKWDAEQRTCFREKSGKGDNDRLTSLRENNGKQGSDQLTKKMELERKTEQEKESKKYALRDVLNHKSSHATNCSKYLNKLVSDLDLSKCEQCTPSYRLLPEDYPLPKVGSRRHLDHAVLNDTWLSVTSDQTFKKRRKNQYEERVLKCEEDRFESDMLLEYMRAAIRSLEELLEEVMNSDINEGVDVVDNLTAIPLRCIERMYGDHGLDVIDLLRQNPAVAVPVILNRLKQKQDEFLKCHEYRSKIWVEVFAKYYRKSLDHRSLQQDQKSLSTKALLAEIKEANAMKRKSDDFIISIISGNSMPVIPDLRLEYPDAGIKDDLYQILKHSANELFPNVEQSAKVMHVWKLFLEPLCHSFQESEKIINLKSIKSQDVVASSNNTLLHGERTLTNAELQSGMPPINDKVETSRQDVFEAYALHTSETQLDAGKQCSGFRNDRIASPIAKFMYDVNQLECSEREEREEGEISPSKEALEEHNCSDNFLETAESTLPVTEHWAGCHTEKEGREVDHKGGNGNSAKGFDDNEKACTQKFSEGSESESGDSVSCLEGGDVDDLCASYEDKEQRMDNEDAEETAASDGTGLVNEDRVFQRCRPLFSTGTAAEGNSAVFYGNDNIYILLRLYQALHECIRTAKVNAAATEIKLSEEKDYSSFDAYEKFLHALYGFLDGTADSTKFEDVCRSIGGNKFYLFLTIDKLIFKLVKQLQVVASDEMAMKLLALHAYEQSHSPGGLIDAVYHANASMLLYDENVYRFEQRFEAGQLFVQLMEGPSEEREALPSAMQSTFAKYLSNFLLLDPLERSQRGPLFLKRHTVSWPLEDAQMGVLKDVLIVNEMKLEISCSTYKATYLNDTEDFLYRRKCNSKKYDCVKIRDLMSKASFKFHRWLDGQI